MQAVALCAQEVLALLAAEHGLTSSNALSRELMASVMRSQLARMYPCPARALLAATRHALEALTPDQDALGHLAADVLEDLQVCGDVVELARVAIAQSEDQCQWLLPAPPSFVVRGDRAYLFGVAVDNAPFLPGEHWQQIKFKGAARFLELAGAEATAPQSLVAFGLRQLDEAEWLGTGCRQTPQQHVEQLMERLRRHGTSGHLPNMKVLGHQGAIRQSYARRWISDCTASGLHVVRMEQPYGSPLWYLAELSSGRCLRSLLLPYHLERERACDQAWRAQLAIDASQNYACSYTVQRDGEQVILKLDFPIPLIAKRRLRFLEVPSAPSDNPYVFVIPSNEEQAERRHLEEQLWFRGATA